MDRNPRGHGTSRQRDDGDLVVRAECTYTVTHHKGGVLGSGVRIETTFMFEPRRTRIGPRLLVKGAVRNVALKANTNLRALARIIEAVLGGSMFAWPFSREGPAVRWLTRDLEEILRPDLAEPLRDAGLREEPYPQSGMILEYSQVGALDVAGFD